MPKDILQQEILLVIGGHINQVYFPKEAAYDLLSPMERVELACWNGLLDRIVPEILPEAGEARLFMIQVQKARNSLYIDLCHRPVTLAKEHSIDPYFLLEAMLYN
jgi:hypothetical protein